MFYLKELELKNFRCHDDYKTNLFNGINIIVGNNAVGKTSILESIYFLGLCKSFKTSDDITLIKQKQEFLYVKGVLIENSREFEVFSSFTRERGKKISVNGNVYKNLSDYYGFFNVVCFSPADLKLIKGESRIKRKFLDVYIGQTDKKYLKNLSDYNKILKERNELLKRSEEIADFDKLLNLYTEKMAAIGRDIITKRKKFINDLEPYINKEIKNISSDKEKIEIVYKTNSEENKIEEEMFKAINVDKVAKVSTIGPHRDDISFLLNGQEAEIYGSQGQQRTIALSIKLGLANYIKSNSERMILLLDDVFGELDFKRQIELLKAVDQGTQVLITTTEINNINNEIINRSKIIKIEEKGDSNGWWRKKRSSRKRRICYFRN